MDDTGAEMAVSSDPMLAVLQKQLEGVKVGAPESEQGQVKEILKNPVLFGTDLCAAGLGDKIEAMFRSMLAGPGAVRATLKKYL